MEKMVGGGMMAFFAMTRNGVDATKGLPLNSVTTMRICHNSYNL